eukprot:2399571-Pleurochrysis_carterae.AAC.1
MSAPSFLSWEYEGEGKEEDEPINNFQTAAVGGTVNHDVVYKCTLLATNEAGKAATLKIRVMRSDGSERELTSGHLCIATESGAAAEEGAGTGQAACKEDAQDPGVEKNEEQGAERKEEEEGEKEVEEGEKNGEEDATGRADEGGTGGGDDRTVSPTVLMTLAGRMED